MNRKILLLSAIGVLAACSRLAPLTSETLSQAENTWNINRPGLYHMIVEVTGDRVDAGTFEVLVQSGEVVSFRRNEQVLAAANGQAYSMEGLYHILHEELGLVEKPELLGAPAGYSAYAMARFEKASGRLMEYSRSVGGASNSIDIRVKQFDIPSK